MARRPDINKRIAKSLNNNSQLSHFVMNVLNPDYIQNSDIIDETTFNYISEFIQGYDVSSIKDIVKGIVFKTLSSMVFTDNDDEDFNNFLAMIAKAVNKSQEVVEVVMDIHNCILLERSDLDDVEIIRNINLVLATNAFGGFRVVSEITSEAASTTTNSNEKESELNMNTVKTGRTITFGNGHTAKTVVNKPEKVEKVQAEIVSGAASDSTDPDKNWDDETKRMAETYLNEMRQYPQFKEYADVLTIDDVVEYQRVIKDGNMNDIHDYITKISNSDPEKSNALFALFMGTFAIELINRIKEPMKVNPKPQLEEGNDSKTKEVTENESKKSEPIHVVSKPVGQSQIQPKPVEKKNNRFDGYREEDHNGYYLHLKRIGLVD